MCERMRARMVEFAIEAGFGRVRLEDGRLVIFDVSRCKTLIPPIGAEVEVQIGDGPRGPVVKELSAAPTLETRDLEGVLAVWGGSPSAVCLSPGEDTVVVVPFERSA